MGRLTAHGTTTSTMLHLDLADAIMARDGTPTADEPLPSIRLLFDHAVRDTYTCVGPNGTYYLTGTLAGSGEAFPGERP